MSELVSENNKFKEKNADDDQRYCYEYLQKNINSKKDSAEKSVLVYPVKIIDC